MQYHMNLAMIGNCRKCGEGYFVSATNTQYCSSHCESTDYTLELEERVEILEEKIEIMQKQLDKCLSLLNIDNLQENSDALS